MSLHKANVSMSRTQQTKKQVWAGSIPRRRLGHRGLVLGQLYKLCKPSCTLSAVPCKQRQGLCMIGCACRAPIRNGLVQQRMARLPACMAVCNRGVMNCEQRAPLTCVENLLQKHATRIVRPRPLNPGPIAEFLCRLVSRRSACRRLGLVLIMASPSPFPASDSLRHGR